MPYCNKCCAAAQPEQAYCTRCGTEIAVPVKRQAPTPPARPPAPGPPTADWASPVADQQAMTVASPSPSGRRRGGRAGAVLAIAVAAVILGGLAVTAWKLTEHRPVHQAASMPEHPSATRAAPPSGGASPTPSASHSGAVAMTQTVRQQTSAAQVATFLGTYFQAINNREYSSYSALFEPALRSTLAQFESGYRSTHDSQELLAGISPTTDGIAATVTFVSRQDPSDSPTGTSCTSWDITLYLKPHGGTYWIRHAPADYHAHYQSC